MKQAEISERLRKDASSIWEAIIHHPFVIELYGGTLPLEKFRFYILQDYYFLVAMMRNIALLAVRAVSVPVMRELLELAHQEATTEFKGYEELLGKLGLTIDDALKAEPAQVNISYASFLLATSSVKPFPEGLAAILPCFSSYAEIACFHREKLEYNKNTLYTGWASVYLSGPYLALVARLKKILNELPLVDYQKLREAFMTASRYEYAFWDTAYRMLR